MIQVILAFLKHEVDWFLWNFNRFEFGFKRKKSKNNRNLKSTKCIEGNAMERIKQQNLLIGDLKVLKRIESWAFGMFCAIIGKGIRRESCNFGTVEKTLNFFWFWSKKFGRIHEFDFREWKLLLIQLWLKINRHIWHWQNIRKQRWNRIKRCKQQKHFQSLILKGNKWKLKIKN